MNLKHLVAQYLIQLNKPELEQYLEYPTDPSMGDVALPCFILAKEHRQSPMQIAQTLAEELSLELGDTDHVASVVAAGPYVNFMMNWSLLGVRLINTIIEQQDDFGQLPSKDETILIESPGPNTNKPLHLGHARNMLLGNSLEAILRFAGYTVHRVDIVNDRGIHICKSMLAYQKLGNNALPNKKSDHFVGDRYVAYDAGLADHPERADQNQAMLIKREEGDSEVRNLRTQMNTRCLDGHAITYARYSTTIDKTYFESDHYLKGKSIVEQGLEDGIFRTNDKGNIVADLNNDQEKVLLRSDGTSIYITQDLALGKVRYEDYHMDRMVYVVGNEQNDHFKALFELFGRMGYPFASQCYHLSYGMIELPDGKMKSRTGNVVDADMLADTMHDKCVDLITERHPDLDHAEISRRAEIIAMAAIKMFILKYDASKNFVFDRENSLAFDGETGPYVLYTYARATTILTKSKESDTQNDESNHRGNIVPSDNSDVTDEEKLLLATLARRSEVVELAAHNYAPTDIAKYTLGLASEFNHYYHHTKILDDQSDQSVQAFRLGLVQAVTQVLHNSLRLLGIDTLAQM